MGLKTKVTNIAIQAADTTVNAVAPQLIMQLVQTNSPYTAQIKRITGPNQFVITDPLGNEQTITYTGDRPLGANGVVLVDGGFCR